jgi:hypothetical protein
LGYIISSQLPMPVNQKAQKFGMNLIGTQFRAETRRNPFAQQIVIFPDCRLQVAMARVISQAPWQRPHGSQPHHETGLSTR